MKFPDNFTLAGQKDNIDYYQLPFSMTQMRRHPIFPMEIPTTVEFMLIVAKETEDYYLAISCGDRYENTSKMNLTDLNYKLSDLYVRLK